MSPFFPNARKCKSLASVDPLLLAKLLVSTALYFPICCRPPFLPFSSAPAPGHSKARLRRLSKPLAGCGWYSAPASFQLSAHKLNNPPWPPLRKALFPGRPTKCAAICPAIKRQQKQACPMRASVPRNNKTLRRTHKLEHLRVAYSFPEHKA